MSALIDSDLLFPADERSRAIARELYAGVKDLPIISPHGHTDPRWFAENQPFPDPAQLLIVPDHYVFRMLFSQGVRLEDLGVPTARRFGLSKPTGARSGAVSPSISTSSAARRPGSGSTMCCPTSSASTSR